MFLLNPAKKGRVFFFAAYLSISASFAACGNRAEYDCKTEPGITASGDQTGLDISSNITGFSQYKELEEMAAMPDFNTGTSGKEECASFLEELSECREQSRKHEDNAVRLGRKAYELDAEILKLKEDLRVCESWNTKKDEMLDKADTEYSECRALLSGREIDIDKMAAENKKIAEACSLEKQGLQRIISNLEVSVGYERARVDIFLGQIDYLTKENDMLREQAIERINKIEAAQAEKNEFRRLYEDEMGKRKTAESEKSALMELYQKRCDENTSLKKENASLKSDIEAIAGEYDLCSAEKQTCTDSLDICVNGPLCERDIFADIVWEEIPENPLITKGLSGDFDTNYIQYPFWILNEDSGFTIFYGGEGSGHIQIGKAHSDDAVVWTAGANNPVIPNGAGNDRWGAHHPIISVEDDIGGKIYKMWYIGDSWGAWNQMLASSTDGETWTKHNGDGTLFGWSSKYNRYSSLDSIIKKEGGMRHGFHPMKETKEWDMLCQMTAYPGD